MRARLERSFKRLAGWLLTVVVRRRGSPALDRAHVRSILVVRQHDQLGDMLCAMPLLSALRDAFPGAATTLVASRVNSEIVQHHPCVDRVLTFEKSFAAWPKFLRLLRSTSYDLAVMPATVSLSLTSSLITLFSGAPVRVGPKSLDGKFNPGAPCFTVAVDLGWQREPRRHQTLRNLDILAPLGIQPHERETRIGLTPGDVEEARGIVEPFRRPHSVVIGLHPGAGKRANRWPASLFVRVANGLHNGYRADIVITAGPMDDEPLSELKRLLDVPALFVENRPIRTVAAIIDQLDLFVTNDTGLMHVAAGTSAPLLSLFGPTDPLQWAPIGKKNRYIRAKDGRIENLPVEEVMGMIDVILQSARADRLRHD